MAEEQVIKLNIEGNPVFKLEGQNGKSAYELWLESGNSGTREDFLNSLKGQDGRDGNNGLPGKDAYAQGSYEMLMGMNVYCENATPDEVIKGLIRGLGDVIKKPFKPLEFDRPQKGQSYINVYGTPHFKVALLGKGAAFGVSIGDGGNGRLDLDSPFGGSDIELEYFNMLGNIVGTYRVSGYAPGNNELTVINEYQFYNDTETVNYELPEVTTVGRQAFHNYAETIKLPKAVRINIGAFNNCSRLKTLEIPSFILKSDNVVSFSDSSDLSTLVINEESDPNVVLNNVNPVAPVTVYNQDRTKKIDKETKTWMPV